jgi:ATP-dependent DNA ligase
MVMKFQQIQKLRDFNKDFKPEKLKYPRLCTIKYDGRHTTIVKRPNGQVDYYSSSGKRFELLDDQCFEDAPVGVYFAEMMGEGREGKLGDRAYSGIQTTMFTNTRKGLFNKHKPVWRIFDYVTMADYAVGRCELPYVERYAYLLEHIPSNFLAYNMEALTIEHEQMFLDKVVKEGYEGIVSTDYEHEWVASKSRKWTNIKWKKRPTADLLCVGYEHGEGKYEGMIGSLILEDKNGLRVGVGSGMSDTDRLRNPDYFIGKVLEVEYEQIMDTYVQATFGSNTVGVTIREDKTKEDID